MREHPGVQPLEFGDAIGLTQVAGIRRIAALGNNPTVDVASVPETIWPGGGLYPFLSSAQTLEIVSTSANDAAAGTGVRTVSLTLLDSTFAEISVTVTLNGIAPVTVSGGPYLRINAAIAASVGSSRTNAGDISIRVSGGGTVIGIMQSGTSFMRQAVYTVPLGFTLNVEEYHASLLRTGGTTLTATLTDEIRLNNGAAYLPFEFSVSSTNPAFIGVNPSYSLAEKTDISLRCVSVSNNGQGVTGAIIGSLYPNAIVPAT